VDNFLLRQRHSLDAVESSSTVHHGINLFNQPVARVTKVAFEKIHSSVVYFVLLASLCLFSVKILTRSTLLSISKYQQA